jgi:hypothetical protein
MHILCFKYKLNYILRHFALSAGVMRRITAQLRLFQYVTGRGQQCAVVQMQGVWVCDFDPYKNGCLYLVSLSFALNVTSCMTNTI